MRQETTFRELLFPDSIDDYMAEWHPSQVVHILCLEGYMSFTYQNMRYNVSRGDLVILQNITAAEAISTSSDFKPLLMIISNQFNAQLNLRSDYGIIGGLQLILNPVMRLSEDDFQLVKSDMEHMRSRIAHRQHPFLEELIIHLLMAHILELYRISLEMHSQLSLSGRPLQILQGFMRLIYQGEYVKHRDLSYYAERLHITPHHLSDVCRDVTGKNASFWIDLFTLREIGQLLAERDLTLQQIADRMNFSSLSYFSRYVQKRLGVVPSKLRG